MMIRTVFHQLRLSFLFAPARTCSSFRSLSSQQAVDLALVFANPLPPLLASLLSRALPPSLSGDALLVALHPHITGLDTPLRTRVMRTRARLEFFKNLSLVIEIDSSGRWMVPTGEVDVTFSFFFNQAVVGLSHKLCKRLQACRIAWEKLTEPRVDVDAWGHPGLPRTRLDLTVVDPEAVHCWLLRMLSERKRASAEKAHEGLGVDSEQFGLGLDSLLRKLAGYKQSAKQLEETEADLCWSGESSRACRWRGAPPRGSSRPQGTRPPEDRTFCS